MTEPVVYALKHPIELRNKDGQVIEEVVELTLKRMNGAAVVRVMNAQAKGPGDFIAALIRETAGIPPSTFERLDAADVMAMVELATPFFGSGPATR